MKTGQTQFLRACSLVVADNAGHGLNLANLRISFTVRKGDLQTPNSAEIRVWNLKEDTAARVGGEFTRLYLQAGYEANLAAIFQGTIKQARKSRSGTDTYLDILAADGDRAYNYAVVNTSLAKGAGWKETLHACVAAFKEHGLQGMITGALPSTTMPRGQALYGMARDHMRAAARTLNTDWSIQDGMLTILPKDGYLPGEAVVLNAQTGLIGSPEQTEQGIRARCLLNPRIRVGSRVKIDNESIVRARKNLGYTAIQQLPRIASDGLYRVLAADHAGDTHGPDWHTLLTCISLGDAVPLALAQRGYV